jgi:hypothetical protein
LIANEKVSFRYADAAGYREVLLFDNYAMDLGKPVGPRKKEADSWRRDFSNGSILVNPQKHTAEIKLGP